MQFQCGLPSLFNSNITFETFITLLPLPNNIKPNTSYPIQPTTFAFTIVLVFGVIVDVVVDVIAVCVLLAAFNPAVLLLTINCGRGALSLKMAISIAATPLLPSSIVFITRVHAMHLKNLNCHHQSFIIIINNKIQDHSSWVIITMKMCTNNM